MSSSRTRSHRSSHNRSSNERYSDYYPLEWCDWYWDNDFKCEVRWRYKNAQHETEWEKREAQQELYVSQDTPRDSYQAPNSLDYIPETQQVYETNNYGFSSNSPVDMLAQELATTDLNAGPPDNFSTAPDSAANQYQYAQYTGAGQYVAEPSASHADEPDMIAPGAPPIHKEINEYNTQTKGLDKRYKIHTSTDFKFGKVLMVLWSEPNGNGKGTEITRRQTGKVPAKFGELAYHSIRRFLIVSENRGHSLCLPILTYGGQGTTKRGVHAEDHAIIYTSKAVMKPGETITKKSIRMVPLNDRYKLDEASRLNYAKVYTVEHNVKVCFIGQVHDSHKQRVRDSYMHTVFSPYHNSYPTPSDQDVDRDTTYAMGNQEPGTGGADYDPDLYNAGPSDQ